MTTTKYSIPSKKLRILNIIFIVLFGAFIIIVSYSKPTALTVDILSGIVLISSISAMAYYSSRSVTLWRKILFIILNILLLIAMIILRNAILSRLG